MNSKQHENLDNIEKNLAVRVLLKSFVIFLAINLTFLLIKPVPHIGKLSAYNRVIPGRLRLPYGDNPNKAFNLTIFQLETIFASHQISAGKKPSNEYRIITIGDSSTWGFLLKPDDTFASILTNISPHNHEGKIVKAYNLGYPGMSLTKDLLLLSHAMQYQPDLILWLITLESLPQQKQLTSPFVENNFQLLNKLNHSLDLKLELSYFSIKKYNLWDETLIGQRRQLADMVRLQLYGVMWAATGIDQEIPDEIVLRMDDLEDSEDYYDFSPTHLPVNELAFNVLDAGSRISGSTPLIIINEPMFISKGKNSHIRYNFYYPRWAYDEYRELLNEQCRFNNWQCLDLWDLVPESEFTNTAIHMTPAGVTYLAEYMREYLKFNN